MLYNKNNTFQNTPFKMPVYVLLIICLNSTTGTIKKVWNGSRFTMKTQRMTLKGTRMIVALIQSVFIVNIEKLLYFFVKSNILPVYLGQVALNSHAR